MTYTFFFFLSHPANSQTADGKGAVNQAWRGPPRPTCLPSKWGRWIMCPFRLGSAGTETKRQGKWPRLNTELFLSHRAKRDATEDRAGASTPRSPGTPAPSTLLLPHTRLPPLGLRWPFQRKPVCPRFCHRWNKARCFPDMAPPEVTLSTSTDETLDSHRRVWERERLFWEATDQLNVRDSIFMEKRENRGKERPIFFKLCHRSPRVVAHRCTGATVGWGWKNAWVNLHGIPEDFSESERRGASLRSVIVLDHY